jgi:hypothetical protein
VQHTSGLGSLVAQALGCGLVSEVFLAVPPLPMNAQPAAGSAYTLHVEMLESIKTRGCYTHGNPSGHELRHRGARSMLVSIHTNVRNRNSCTALAIDVWGLRKT